MDLVQAFSDALALNFMPHGHCYFWRPEILWLHVVSDAIVALSYYSIPIGLIYLIGKRRDVPFRGIFILFGAFIAACGTTHLMNIWTTWYPSYVEAGFIKLITALVSAATAVVLIRRLPSMLRLPKLSLLEAMISTRTDELRDLNERLSSEIEIRKKVENTVLQLNESLAEKVQVLQTIFDVLPIGLAVASDGNCKELQANPHLRDILRTESGERVSMEGASQKVAFQVYHEGKLLTAEEQPMQRAAGKTEVIQNFEEDVVFDDGIHRSLLAYAAPVLLEKAVRGCVGVFVDITERKTMERAIKASLGEKDVLLHEVHHRVKNNLQMVSSILQMQAKSLNDPRLTKVLDESRDRIRAIALVHERLYRSSQLSQVELKGYLETLVQSLVRAAVGVPGVRAEIDVESIVLPVDIAIPLGLILNELVTNSLKHAYPQGQAGIIRIIGRNLSDRISIAVVDNGRGIQEDFDPRNSASVGWRIVQLLSSQLGAEVKIDRQGGFSVTLEVPLLRSGSYRPVSAEMV